MTLERTTIIPTKDCQKAVELFSDAIAEKNVLIMVVLGDDDAANRVIKEAEKGAKMVPEGMIERKMIWIKNKTFLEKKCNALEKEIKALNAGAADISDEDLSGIVAFTVSCPKNVMFIIKNTDDLIELRVERAFLKAGEEECIGD